MIFSTFFDSVKKNQNILGVFLTILAHFSMSKKTQDVLRGFLSIFSTFFSSVKEDPGCYRRFSGNF